MTAVLATCAAWSMAALELHPKDVARLEGDVRARMGLLAAS